jgi:deoxyuridine 5'-triphosphate nucleotidohydrolase
MTVRMRIIRMSSLNYRVLNKNPYKPTYATKGSACFDIPLPSDAKVEHGVNRINLSIAFDLEPDTALMLYPRSSTLLRYNIMIPTAIVDHDYKQSIYVILYSFNRKDIQFREGMRLLQGMVVPVKQLVFIPADFSVNSDFHSGFGSTGV